MSVTNNFVVLYGRKKMKASFFVLIWFSYFQSVHDFSVLFELSKPKKSSVKSIYLFTHPNPINAIISWTLT